MVTEFFSVLEHFEYTLPQFITDHRKRLLVTVNPKK